MLLYEDSARQTRIVWIGLDQSGRGLDEEHRSALESRSEGTHASPWHSPCTLVSAQPHSSSVIQPTLYNWLWTHRLATSIHITTSTTASTDTTLSPLSSSTQHDHRGPLQHRQRLDRVHQQGRDQAGTAHAIHLLHLAQAYDMGS